MHRRLTPFARGRFSSPPGKRPLDRSQIIFFPRLGLHSDRGVRVTLASTRDSSPLAIAGTVSTRRDYRHLGGDTELLQRYPIFLTGPGCVTCPIVPDLGPVAICEWGDVCAQISWVSFFPFAIPPFGRPPAGGPAQAAVCLRESCSRSPQLITRCRNSFSRLGLRS